MSKNYGVNDIEKWKFNYVDIPPVWRDHLGNLPENFRMLIHGKSGHGKTEYMMQLTKMLSVHYGKVHLNSAELGKSAALKESFIRNKMDELVPGTWMLGDKSQKKFEVWFNKLEKPNSGRVIVLDSIDEMHLTFAQFQQLRDRFPHKAIIIICWDDPFDTQSKKIRYLCDLKVHVHEYKARIRSRFGGNKDYVIWDKAAKKRQPSLFENYN